MELNEAIDLRRAYRSLDPVEITDADVRTLSDAAGLAASCFNKQPWRFVFVREAKALDGVKQSLSDGNRWARDASMIVAVCTAVELGCRMPDGRDYALFDTGMATAHLLLKSVELGLVSHPIAGFDPEKVRSALDVPAGMNVVTLLIVGRHSDSIKPVLSEKQAESERARPSRNPADTWSFRDHYGRG